MKRIFISFKYRILAIILCLVSVFSCILPNALLAYADTGLKYELTNVLDDLNNSTINDKLFSKSDYPFNSNGTIKVLTFVEYCYSPDPDKQADYGLYAYVYNPQGLNIDTTSTRNAIQLSYGKNNNFVKYRLQFLNYSTQTGTEGLFYKFKVVLNEMQRDQILYDLNQSCRIYKIGSIELSANGELKDYAVSDTYYYYGVSEGYGMEDSEPLSCQKTAQEETLSLNVKHTYYRPDGYNGTTHTQDTLHSVYFSVPNSYLENYGEMTAIHAMWYNALTLPIYVTATETVYDRLSEFVGNDEIDGGNFQYVSKDNRNTDLEYALIASKLMESASWNNAAKQQSFLSFNANRYLTHGDYFEKMFFLFYADTAQAGDYTLSGEDLLQRIKEQCNDLCENNMEVAGKYSSLLFEEYDETPVDVNITMDKTFTLTQQTISQNWWQKIIGGSSIGSTTTFDGIHAIHKVTASDFKSDKTKTCKDLFIATTDYNAFKDYYDTATANDETVFLFRYYMSDYTSYQVATYKHSKGDWTLLGTVADYDYVDSNSYFAKEWVQLDFDIIDLTFTKDNSWTVIPVVMTPIDIVPDVTPPTEWVDPQNFTAILKLILLILIIIVLLIVLWPVLPFIFKGIFWVIALPFKAIGKAIQKRKQEKHEQEVLEDLRQQFYKEGYDE